MPFVKEESESLDEQSKHKPHVAWPIKDNLISITDFEQLVATKLTWCLDSDFKRECGGFKITFKNGLESPWCAIHPKMVEQQESEFTGLKTVDINTKRIKSTLQLLD